MPLFLPSRQLLECLVRQRVRNSPNIVVLQAHDGGTENVLAAELVVDATGRGSRTPTFLDHLGYNRPVRDHIDVRLTYTSQLLRLPPQNRSAWPGNSRPAGTSTCPT